MRKTPILFAGALVFALTGVGASTPAWSSSSAAKPKACKNTSIGEICAYFRDLGGSKYDILVDFTASKSLKSANIAYAQHAHTPEYDGRIDDMKKGATRSAKWNKVKLKKTRVHALVSYSSGGQGKTAQGHYYSFD